ncbi:hypothetical protein M440DRAFT_1332186 [Trichoderma longibrachiatum ATCC 18648]|uniref:Wax synthase domain-containing protein n=1 Tax=Trichoderma longibrachiatum ATCC 18648 TaxID=983965 RepID=A0A2T4C697_TRILO|nr:hypothetical protein M440DRAFT_1332186 [Trichoderma longibrachiatum ATCC 18648]
MWLFHQLSAALTTRALRSLHVTSHDFALPNQGIIPRLAARGLSIRGVVSVHWIWTSYTVLSGAHDILAIMFVSLLGWDGPEEWPPLFGSAVEAYSLRRFWSKFWHQLHSRTCEPLMPPFLRARSQRRRKKHDFLRNSLRALWIFCLSAMFHALSNWVTFRKGYAALELRFFLCNFGVCLLETVGERAMGGFMKPAHRKLTRPAGYAWVLFVFVCLVPGWKYPVMVEKALNALERYM